MIRSLNRSFSDRFGLDGESADANNRNRNYFGRFRRNAGLEDQERNQNLNLNDDSNSSYDINGDSDDDSNSAYTTYTVETIKSKDEKKPEPTPITNAFTSRKKSTQLLVGAKTAKQDLLAGRNDITKASITVKEVPVTKRIALGLLEVVRGDDKSWEATAVDILRQKARWDSIVLDTCTSAPSMTNDTIDKNDSGDDRDDANSFGGINDNATYLDLLLSGIVNVDTCAYLHLTGLTWSLSTSFALQSLVFSKSLTKLQLDFIDLSEHVPAMATSLSGNKSITCFISSRCGLLDDHLEILLSHLPEKIEELRIFGNKCRAKGLASLSDVLHRKSSHSLKILDLSFQHIEPHEAEMLDLSGFCDALGGNTTLKVLDLDNDSLDDGHLTHIVAALCRNKTLEEIMLNHNRITGIGVGMLASKFGEMKGLKKISMYSNIFDNTSGGSS